MKRILILLLSISTLVHYGQEASYTIKNLKANTRYSDFGVSYYKGSAIFASSRPTDNKSRKDWTNGQPYLDLYMGTIDPETGEITGVDNFSKKLATKYHESNAVFTKDQKTVYFTRNNYFHGKYGKDSLGWNNLKMYRAEIDAAGKWVNVVELPFNNDNYSVGHPALSPDDKTLYFTSDMPGSLGATDIFKVSITGDSYGTPKNLGSAVNGEGREMFPYVSESGKLYYSSDKGGFGGLDIYVTDTRNIEVSPMQLPRPINSNLDDFAFIINEETQDGYFSSNRSGGKGDDDIYYFNGHVAMVLPCSENLSGVVKDRQTGALLPGSKVVLYKDGVAQEEVVVGQDASFLFKELDCETDYKVAADKDLYTGETLGITTTDILGQTLNMELKLRPDRPVITQIEEIDECQRLMDAINTIYFDLDKYYIRPDAARELDKIVFAMQKCPDARVIAGSHTDSRASHAYNETLSQNRAKSTVDYIVKHGIMRQRLTAQGYGETELVNRCKDGVKCSEVEHQMNRRTEFVIIRD